MQSDNDVKGLDPVAPVSTRAKPLENHPAQHQKTLGRGDLTLFTVSAILLLDPLMSTAAMGVSSVFWWIFLGVLFFIPFGLISAELGTTYPEQGGIYAWVRDAFGKRWGSRVIWAYWSNVAVWNPAMFILFAGMFSQIFYPELPLHGQIIIGIVLSWFCVWVNVLSLEVGKWVPNLGAISKIAIILALILGGSYYTARHGMANPITTEHFIPSWDGSLRYVPAVIYGMLGFELMSCGSEEIKDPARDLPWAIATSGLIIGGLYTLGTLGILVAVPVGEIHLVEGLMKTFLVFFGSTGAGYAIALLLGVASLYTFFSSAVTWTLGTNRAMAEAAQEGEFPSFFAWEHPRYGTPVGAAVANGVVCTAVFLLYGFLAGSNEDLFWNLFAFSAAIYFFPYCMMMLAFIKLRRVDGARHRPFRFPGKSQMAMAAAAFCGLLLIFCMGLIFYVPGEGMQWPIFLGTA
ncbi:MAG: APC family permease, partial [Gammaproteobacteria bacterium]